MIELQNQSGSLKRRTRRFRYSLCAVGLLIVLLTAWLLLQSVNQAALDSRLLIALRDGRVETARRLLQHGAGPNAREGNDIREMITRSGLTALMRAVMRGDREETGLLLGSGATVDLRDGEQRTALWYAAEEGDPAIVDSLLRHGADVNARSRRSGTALTVAVLNRRANVIKLLTKARAR